jgi:hypothetical protein
MTPPKPQLQQQLEAALDQTQQSNTDIKIQVGSTEITFKNETKSDTTSRDVIAYTAEHNIKVEVGSLIETLSTSFANFLPEALRTQPISFKNLMVIYSRNKTNRTSKWLFALDLPLGKGLSFAELPLVGDSLPEANRPNNCKAIPAIYRRFPSFQPQRNSQIQQKHPRRDRQTTRSQRGTRQ